jgi:hypothetical protein
MGAASERGEEESTTEFKRKTRKSRRGRKGTGKKVKSKK